MRTLKFLSGLWIAALLCSAGWAAEADSVIDRFVSRHCADCHGSFEPEAELDLTSLSQEFTEAETAKRWVRVHDRIAGGEMPPRHADQPNDADRAEALEALRTSLTAAERQTKDQMPALRRLTRSEYENTMRDLFDMPGIALADELPEDGSAHGFDKHPEALDVSHVTLLKYLEAADHILDYAIATRPEAPKATRRRISLANRGGFVAHVLLNGDGVLLEDKRPDPQFPPAADQSHFDHGAHERLGSFETGATVGLFRHEDESFNPYFVEHVTIYPARYRVRTSLWSFQWDKGQVLPARGTESGRLSIVQLTRDGRGGQHPSRVLGYFDAPDTEAQEHELVVWLNQNELIGFNAASLAPAVNYSREGRAMAFTGPGLAVDWLEIEGPLYESWPPASHRRLFGDLPIVRFRPEEHPETTPPARPEFRQLGAGMNRPDPVEGIWTVHSDKPLADAKRLLAEFLPDLFRRPIKDETVGEYLEIVRQRLDSGDCFELAMRAAYRTAMISPDFLFHVRDDEDESSDYALASRLSYLLWNSRPDDQLIGQAAQGALRQPEVLQAETERLLSDDRSERFIDDFLGQWLRLRRIAATDPDRKLYPEFSPYLQDSMVAETKAYFRELLEQDLDATHLVRSDFVMVNEKLARHYSIPEVTGSEIRRVPLPDDCPRGGFLTQGSILKITADGTTTSPVPRGAFVLDRILGEPPEPPPANVAAIEPDVRGATTVREQLAKHRDNTTCASCHLRIDPPGFALESFDVIGGYRQRYRSIGEGDPAPRGDIDPFIGIGFRLGPEVDSRGELPDGRTFAGIREYQDHLATDSDRLLRNLARQLTVYATGREVRFSDRAAIDKMVQRTKAQGGGLRTLVHQLVASPLFTGLAEPLDFPASEPADPRPKAPGRMMAAVIPDLESPALGQVPKPETPPPPKSFDFEGAQHYTLQVDGLFMPERVAAFREFVDQVPEAEVIRVDFETAQATLAVANDADQIHDEDSEKVIQRLDQRVRHLSRGAFVLKPLPKVSLAELTRVEIGIQGLDCQACCLGVYDLLIKVEGVTQARASFRDSLAIAWIDPDKTNRDTLREALSSRGVTLIDD